MGFLKGDDLKAGEFPMPEGLRRVLGETPELGRAFMAGGCVRDWLLGCAAKDFDVEVYGISYETLVAALSRWGRTDLVGRSFGVVKLSLRDGEEYDFTLARRDSKTAAGHKGFAIEFDAELRMDEATARRDFTINSLLFDPRAGRLIDLHRGEEDLHGRILRHTSAAFTEDPLRVLRGFQFAGRFELTAAPETLELCRSIAGTLGELPKDRIWHEWRKWALKSSRPSMGLTFLRDCGWLAHFPEVAAMIGTRQDPRWHPEGDVFTHTCHCCDAMARLPEFLAGDEDARTVWMLAMLAHDFGKAVTTVIEGEAVSSPGHESASVPLAESFLERIGAPLYLRERIVPLVFNHMFHADMVTDRSVRRLARRLAPESVEALAVLMTADSMGRPPRPVDTPPFVNELRAKAAELNVHAQAPKPIFLGRHLLARGMKPGPEVGKIVAAGFEAQLDGVFADLEGAEKWLDAFLKNES